MPATSAWYETFNVSDASLIEKRIGAIRREGVQLERRVPHSLNGPGVVFFDSVSSDLREFLRAASGDGCGRVLGIATEARGVEDEAAWELLETGASDVLAWNRSSAPAAQVAARLERWRAVDRLVDSPLVQTNLLGDARAWRAVLRQVVEIAHFTDSPVLILGESGTGKELLARLIHGLDRREQKRGLVVLDCTTVVPELAGSEFFGHERGAFTGATAAREGAFALADGGTLFLDEIGDLPLTQQAQLLRAVQERTYKPVGSNLWRSTRFRLVCATHRRLAEDLAAGTFRADLYYRIGAVVCHVPPLRERPEDILLLFRHFVSEFSGRDELTEIDEPVRQLLLRRSYPGNVRELQQLARRTACRHVGTGPVSVGDIPDDERPTGKERAAQQLSLEFAIREELARGAGLKAISRAAAEAAIRLALGEANGNLQLAARRLGVTDRALQMRRAAAAPSGISNGRRTA
jgi:transcriptional regulator with GAF, ATPase, and Fis domain